MKINSDLTAPALVKYTDSTWLPSPTPGVDRKMLEREGDEKAVRATTIVRYRPESSFPSHNHDGGEEFLVLSGKFSDKSGNFCRGFYVRNPVGSRHAPWSDLGTTIFVKLGQIDPADRSYVRLDTEGADWQDYRKSGFRTLLLHRFSGETVRLVTLEQGRIYPEQSFPGGSEIFVIKGELRAENTDFTTDLAEGDWLRCPARLDITISTGKAGVTFYLKTGHLPPAL